MKKTYTTLLLISVLSIGFVTALYLIRPKPVKNGFNRGHIYTAQKLNELELKFNSFYINKLSSTRIYLGNVRALLLQFSCGFDLTDSLYQRVAYDAETKQTLELLKQHIIKKTDPKGNSFSTDGFLSLNEANERMVYSYYYRNSFTCLDAKLNVLYTGKLIDTNSIAKIELGEYKAGNKTIRTMAKPALIINKRGYTNGNCYYNHSALAADNEKYEVFKAHEVFDVYRLADGSYSHSVYLPKYKGEKLTDFALRGDILIALYNKHLLTYLLDRKEAQAR
ncbi:hypothetical protein ABIE26_003943 [Pedobacter africanus]|uniref:Uncharacterized protein n=1 Tax=Pedobacter africanus TaxID=151894 RepID=A0ACC6L0W6_9SPHI|nr:hypothetical protein [Pedobacter africanus]MDR6785244.1 hypothetical protein [Pedobacter africanus]